MPALQRAFRRVRAALGWGRAAGEAERRRIANDLHDGPLQSVIALEMRLAVARSLIARDPEAALKELEEAADLAGAVVAELRVFQRTLSPPPMASNDLVALARRLVEDFAADSRIEARFRAPEGPLMAPPEICLELAQILREALANVRKHARAGRVVVVLAQLAKGAEVSIEDNGVGFGFSGRFGLAELEARGGGPRSIMQRVRDLRGELAVESRPGQGSRLEIRVPL